MPEEDKTTDSKPDDEKKSRQFVEEPPIQTHHELTLAGRTLAYTASAGMMPLKDEVTGEILAQIFHTSYTLDGLEDPARRPLMFVFNGGPGSASAWLHMGAVGPRRVVLEDEGWMPALPYHTEPNRHTWLDVADLVFIDPVGTGYSRPKDDETGKKYWSLEGDLESVGEFIRLYVTRHKRWSSPLFLAGESYGTTRSAGLAGHLIDKGITFAGIILISTILNFQTARFERGNDLPYSLFLPTYAATAWYHDRLPPDLQAQPLDDVLAEVEEWATGEYVVALALGDRLIGQARAAVASQLARYTGLSETYVDQTDLRIHIGRFCKELLRDERRTVGRLDSRYKGIDALAVSEFPDFDPASKATTPAYTAAVNSYFREELGYETDDEYLVSGKQAYEAWEYPRGKFPDTSEALRAALAKNPFTRVHVAQGYYDLATPHYAWAYTLNHMGLDPALHANIETTYYEAGHMMYVDVSQHARLKGNVARFVRECLAR
jgi:carboxypeptidase C (cathepsin A)